MGASVCAERGSWTWLLSEVSLTHVPRDHLLPAPWQWLLLDKNAVAVVVGILGVLLLARWHRRLLVIGLLTVLPWLLACCLLGLPRYLEPAIPLLLFGNVIAVVVVVPRAVALLRSGRTAPTTGAK